MLWGRHISYTMTKVRFKFRCNTLISGKIIKEMLGSVASGTPCRRCCVAAEVRNASVLRKQSLVSQLEFLFVGFSTKSSSPPCMLNALLVQLHFSELIVFDEECKSWISSFCHFVQPAVTSSPQATYIFWKILLVCRHIVGFLYLSVDGICWPVLAGTLWGGDRTVMTISCFFVPEFIVLYRAEHKKNCPL